MAAFYAATGTKVTIVEAQERLLPQMDREISQNLQMIFKRQGLAVHMRVLARRIAEGSEGVEMELDGGETLTASAVLAAVGRRPNTDGLCASGVALEMERGFIRVNERFETSLPGVYAIGDIVPGPALAHVASAEAICCVEAICGLDPAPVDYSTIPSCVFTQPEVASVGMTEQQAAERGIAVKIGRFPFTASGKATAAGDRDGFVKLIFDEQEHLLGAHMVGASVTEMLAEPTLARKLGATAHQIARTIHAHPTMNEGVMEAAEAALGAAIHL